MKSRTLLAAAAALCLASAQTAWAHPGHGTEGGFAAGMSHPVSGVDHILAMVAVGLCAAHLGGRALWLLPATFLGLMVGGGLLALGGAPVPLVEQGIAASVLVLGLLVAAGKKVGLPATAALVSLFALFHGHAHGSEMHAGLSPAAYAAGFVLATAALHAAGIAAGLALKHTPALARQLAGAAIAVSGLLLFWI